MPNVSIMPNDNKHCVAIARVAAAADGLGNRRGLRCPNCPTKNGPRASPDGHVRSKEGLTYT